MSDIFISYARADKPVAEALAAFLKSRYLDVWWDAEIYAGEDFHDRILVEIGHAKAVIAIWSDSAVASRWVRGEASLADEQGKLIMCYVPGFDTHRLPINFRTLHCESVEARERLIVALEAHGVIRDGVRADADDRLWEQVREASDVHAFKLYQSKFPDGRHADEASRRLRELSGHGAVAAGAPGRMESPLVRMIDTHDMSISAVAISSDGARAVTASISGTAALWDIVSGRQLANLRGHTSGVRSVAIAPDGWRAITGSDDCTAKIWDLDAGRLLATLPGHRWGVSAVAFSPDGMIAATGCDDYAIRLWDVASGTLKRTIPKQSFWARAGHNGTIPVIAFAERGRWMVTGSWDGSVKVWQMPHSDLVATLREHASAVTAIAVSPDDSRLISGTLDGGLCSWPVGTWANGACFKTDAGDVRSLAALNSWGVLAACGDAGIKIFDMASAETMAELRDEAATCLAAASFLDHECAVNSVAVSADGRRAVTGDVRGKFAIWNLSQFARA